MQCNHEHEGGLLLESEPFMHEYYVVVFLPGVPHDTHTHTVICSVCDVAPCLLRQANHPTNEDRLEAVPFILM